MKPNKDILVLTLFSIIWICKPIPYQEVAYHKYVHQQEEEIPNQQELIPQQEEILFLKIQNLVQQQHVQAQPVKVRILIRKRFKRNLTNPTLLKN